MYKKGFTIIETLVAIAILMISIAGPLVIATKGLTAALYAKDQSIATFLAIEGMEAIRNAKDATINGEVPGMDFATLFNNQHLGKCMDTTNDRCATGLPPDVPDVKSPPYCNLVFSCLLYEDENPSSTKSYKYLFLSVGANQYTSLFTRYFYVTKVNDDEYQVTVVIKWNEGTVPNQASISSVMTSTIL